MTLIKAYVKPVMVYCNDCGGYAVSEYCDAPKDHRVCAKHHYLGRKCYHPSSSFDPNTNRMKVMP